MLTSSVITAPVKPSTSRSCVPIHQPDRLAGGLVDGREAHMRDHHGGQAVANQLAVRQEIVVELRERAAVDRDVGMRVAARARVRGEVLRGRRHAGALRARDEPARERGDRAAVRMQRPVADHFGQTQIAIDARREAHVDATARNSAAMSQPNDAAVFSAVCGPRRTGGRARETAAA